MEKVDTFVSAIYWPLRTTAHVSGENEFLERWSRSKCHLWEIKPSVRDKNNFKIVKVFCKIIWMSRGSRNPLSAPSLKIIAAVKRDCAKQTCQCDEGGGVESQTPGFHGGKGNAPPKRFNWTGWKLKKNSTVEWNGFWARKLIRHVRGRSQVCQTLIGFKWMAFSAAGAAGAALSRR